MKLDTKLYLKWLESNHPAFANADYTLLNLCVLAAFNDKKQVIGFTAFEPRALDAKIMTRFKERQTRPEFKDASFVLYIPDFIKHRLEGILGDAKLQVKFTSFLKIKESGGVFYLRDKLKVVSVDDSPVLLKFLSHSFEEFGYVETVAQVSDPLKAVDKIIQMKPDLVTMDIQMPGITGVSVVKSLLAKQYFPVIVISSLNLEEGSLVFEALNSGAFDYVQKPKYEDKEAFKEELRVKMTHAIEFADSGTRKTIPIAAPRRPAAAPSYPSNLVWCIGSSTGGTQALTRIFTSMPEKVPPTLVVQHIPAVFSKAFADSLNALVPFTVKEAVDGEVVLDNHVYIAAGAFQMGVEQKLGKLYLTVKDAAPVNRFKPSVDYLFNDVAKIRGLKIVAAILTGMGKDGAGGMKTLKSAGARTLAQDQASCAVYGMPRAAVELGVVDRIVSLDDFAQALLGESVQDKKTG